MRNLISKASGGNILFFTIRDGIKHDEAQHVVRMFTNMLENHFVHGVEVLNHEVLALKYQVHQVLSELQKT